MAVKDSASSRARRPHLIGMTVVWATGILFVSNIAIRWFVCDYVRVPSDSMFPTIPKGSIAIIDKRGFGNVGPFYEWKRVPTAKVERGDLVMYYVGEDGPSYLHRIIGLPGDRVELKNRRLMINGAEVPSEISPGPHVTRGRFQYQLVAEKIGGREITVAWMLERWSGDSDAVVPEHHYFVLGDNRDNALDSRHPKTGFISSRRLIGKVVKVIAPD